MVWSLVYVDLCSMWKGCIKDVSWIENIKFVIIHWNRYSIWCAGNLYVYCGSCIRVVCPDGMVLIWCKMFVLQSLLLLIICSFISVWNYRWDLTVSLHGYMIFVFLWYALVTVQVSGIVFVGRLRLSMASNSCWMCCSECKVQRY